jgi:nickel superoxide dismutase
MSKFLVVLIVAAAVSSLAGKAFAHCQVPCGIYGDEMRFQQIEEHTTTIETSMNRIAELSKGDINYNQLIRWVSNKDEHAQKIQDIVNAYFLTQRLKLDDGSDAQKTADYIESLGLLHQMLVHAMKCKQTVDVENVTKLREAAAAFHEVYFKDKEHDHE